MKKIPEHLFPLLVSSAMMCAVLFSLMSPAFALEVTLNSTRTSARPGQKLFVTATADSLSEVVSADLALCYNAQQLDYQSITPGPGFGSSSFNHYHQSGEVRFSFANLNPLSGGRNLATISLQLQRDPPGNEVLLYLCGLTFYSSSGTQVAATRVDATVTISATTVPTNSYIFLLLSE